MGASGAIFGLFGAAWADLIQNWGLYKKEKVAYAMLRNLTFATTLNLTIGLMPYLDNFAHVGGFVTGIFCGLTVLVSVFSCVVVGCLCSGRVFVIGLNYTSSVDV